MKKTKQRFEWIFQRLTTPITKKLLFSFRFPEKFTMLNLAIRRFENSFHVKFSKKQYTEILKKFVNDPELQLHFERKEYDRELYSLLSLSLIKPQRNGGKYVPENLKITPLKVKGFDVSLEVFDKALYNQEMAFNLHQIDIDWFLSFDDQDKLSFAIEQLMFEELTIANNSYFKKYIENMYKNKKFCELYQDKLDLSF